MIRRTKRSVASVPSAAVRPLVAAVRALYRRAAVRAPSVAARQTRAQKALFTWLVGAASVAAIALATIEVEDAAKGWTAGKDVPILLWLCGVLAVWAGLVGWRRYLDRAAGTLYHVRGVPATMRNWHDTAQERAERRFLRLQDVTRPVPMTTEAGVIEARPDIAWLEDKLGDRFAADDQATGFTLAPDLLAPLAFGLGYRLTLPRQAHFLDFGSESPEFDWAIHERPPAEGFVRVDVTRTEGTTGATGIHVHAHFTPRAHDPSLPKGCAPLPFDVRATFEVGVAGPNGGLAPSTVGTVPGVGAVHPAAAVEVWVRAIWYALHESRGEPVILTAAVPKAVGLAAGYVFAPAHRPSGGLRQAGPPCGLPGSHGEACNAPWRYLVPLNFNQRATDPDKQWEPVWLLNEQRDPRELLHTLGVSP